MPATVTIEQNDFASAESTHDAHNAAAETKLPARKGSDTIRGLLALADQAFVSGASFVALMLVAQLCPRSALNVYALSWSILSVFRAIQERLLAAPYVVFVHERERNTESFLGSSLVHQTLFALVATTILAALAVGFQLWGGPVGMAGCMFGLALGAPMILLRDHLRAVSCAHLKYHAALLLSLTAFVLQTAFIGLPLWYASASIAVVFPLMGLASLIPSLVWLAWRPQPWNIAGNAIRRHWRTVTGFSRWLVAARCFPTAAHSILPWIVLWNVGSDAPGIMAPCLTLANVAMMFVTGANSFFQPKAVKAYQRQGKLAMMRVLAASAVAFATASAAFCLGYAIFGEWLLVTIFGDDFAGNSTLLTLLGLSVLIVSFSIVAGNGMAAMQEPRGLFWGEVSFGIITTVCAYFLSIQFGLIGAAVGVCCGSLVATVVEGTFLAWLLKSKGDPRHGGTTP